MEMELPRIRILTCWLHMKSYEEEFSFINGTLAMKDGGNKSTEYCQTGIFMCTLRRHVKNPCTALVPLCKVRGVTAVLDIEREPG